MKERYKRLYNELEFLMNYAPVMDDCTDEENLMYHNMEKLRISIENCGYVEKTEDKNG